MRTFSASTFSADIDVLAEIFPSRVDLDAMLDTFPSTPLGASLAVVDPLVPPPSQYKASNATSHEYDSQGFSKYARTVHGLLFHLADDRQTAKQNFWALQHFLAVAIYAEELKDLPSEESPVFAKTVTRAMLQGVLDKVHQLTAYLLSSTAEEQWHVGVTNALLSQGSSTSVLDGAGQLVADLVSRAKRQSSIRESRILHSVLRHALSTATKADAEQWMGVARKIEKLGKSSEPDSAVTAIDNATISPSCILRDCVLHHPLRPRTHTTRPVPERACCGHAWHPSIQGEH